MFTNWSCFDNYDHYSKSNEKKVINKKGCNIYVALPGNIL